MQPALSHLYEATPIWLDVFFSAITLLTLSVLYTASRRVSGSSATRLLVVSLVWLAGLALLAYNHFFQQLKATPPHFILVIAPPLLLIGGIWITPESRAWIKALPLSLLTLLHIVRVPVELILYGLYIHQQIPQLMTFTGRNYDILAGLTAPLITYYVFGQKQMGIRWLLLWNFLALGLVLTIVIQAFLSAPLPFQQMAFEQPNVGILKAPYIWLPGFIVPVVLFSHVVAIQRLLSLLYKPTINSADLHQT